MQLHEATFLAERTRKQVVYILFPSARRFDGLTAALDAAGRGWLAFAHNGPDGTARGYTVFAAAIPEDWPGKVLKARRCKPEAWLTTGDGEAIVGPAWKDLLESVERRLAYLSN